MQLRDYQEEGLQALWSYFMNHSGNPVLAWPTGSGKSLVPAEFIRRTMFHYPNQRFLVTTHVKELIEQNHKKLIGNDKEPGIWPDAPAGIYSAGLKQKDILNPIIFGGVQSMVKIPDAFGHRDIMFVDEAHLISPNETSSYQKLIGRLRQINPKLKVIGMSATPYRVGQGLITDGGLFTHIAHDLTSLDNFNKLVRDGYLSPLIPKKTHTELDVSNVSVQAGDFIQSQLQHEVDKAEITWKALQEAVYYGQNRKSWLIYATGIEHADHIAEMLNKLGIECASVHSRQPPEYNDAALEAHKELRLRAIVSFSKLTTGLDHPEVDFIVMLRPTMSVVLWVQMLGRGTRIADGKTNCLVLDFAKNSIRLGPINDPVIPRKKGDKGGDLPIKICETCKVYNHIKATNCISCEAPFSFKVKIKETAGTEILIKGCEEAPVIETMDVSYVTYGRKQKEGKSPFIVATYFCGMDVYKELVFPESKNRKFFCDWWRMRSPAEPPLTTTDALSMVSQLRPPRRIRVHLNRMYNGRKTPEVLSSEF